MKDRAMSGAALYAAFGAPWTVELIIPEYGCRSHKPYREWKKSQKKIRRERGQRGRWK